MSDGHKASEKLELLVESGYDCNEKTVGVKDEPRRWFTIEFAVYYMVIAQALFYGIKSVYLASSPSHPSYNEHQLFLSDGWIPGRQMDLSDRQYASFRKNIPSLSLLMSIYLVASFTIRRQQADVVFRSLCGLIFLFILHGFNVTKILLIAGVNYLIVKSQYRRFRPIIVWGWALSVLFITEWLEFPFFPKSLFIGFYKRWNIVFKITVLRMISFAMDYHWFDHHHHHHHHHHHQAAKHPDLKLTHKASCKDGCSETHDCEKLVAQTGCSEYDDFDWPQYLAYLFYPPLYLAGPILTFNSFIHQLKQAKVNRKYAIQYGFRLLLCMIFFDVLLHYCHVVAIKESKAFDHLTAADFGLLGFFNLKVIWLKLLVIWRYFRTIALIDGFNPPENMLRCMSNNYSGMAFWRSWHRSFYQWILRYIYVPLGGSNSAVWNMWLVFMFVAVWHDLKFHLLAWSWLVCLFIVPEMVCLWAVSRRHSRIREWNNYRIVAGVAATACICLMMVANLVGFAIGLDGMKLLLHQILTWRGMVFSMNALCSMFAASQIMFENFLGQLIGVNGWIRSIRPVSPDCIFLTLYNGLEQLQLLVDRENLKSPSFEEVKSLPNESVISANGRLQSRPNAAKRSDLASGHFELDTSSISILNRAQPSLPIVFKSGQALPEEDRRLEFRYLDLRRFEMQRNIRFRSHVTRLIRAKMDEMRFIDIETPLLFKSTPEGASEFIVIRGDGYGYALPQSPQQFKQLLVIGGFERYYQIARCFRNEDLRSDRQPEFTQLDIEMGFSGEEDVMRSTEELLAHIWKETYQTKPVFHRMTYDEAISAYGTDKPCHPGHLGISTADKDRWPVRGESLCVPRKLVDDRTIHLFNTLAVDGTLKRSIAGGADGEKIIFYAERDVQCNVGNTLLGHIRRTILRSSPMVPGDDHLNTFLWITKFPLFRQSKNGLLEPMHHPFTAPIREHVELLSTDPLMVRAHHYDLVLNGTEIGGGSVRIHDSQLQEDIFRRFLKLQNEEVSLFKHLIDALRSGAPPHAGIALGLDRLLAIMCGAASIRDVIAFPKNSVGYDAMFKTPTKLQQRFAAAS